MSCRCGRVGGDRSAPQEDPARIRRDVSGDAPGQGRLARPRLAGEGDELAGTNREADVGQGLHRSEARADPGHLQQWRWLIAGTGPPRQRGLGPVRDLLERGVATLPSRSHARDRSQSRPANGLDPTDACIGRDHTPPPPSDGAGVALGRSEPAPFPAADERGREGGLTQKRVTRQAARRAGDRCRRGL